MAIKNELFSRIQLKYDSYANWTNSSVAGKGANLVLKSGEIGICAIPSGSTAVNGNAVRPQIMFKVGDGTSAFSALPWASALAADVYDWAKKDEASFRTWVKGLIDVGDIDLSSYYNKTQVDGLLSTNSTNDQKYAKDYADALIAALDITDKEVAGKYVSAVSQTDGKISVTRASLPTYTLTTGETDGTVKFNGSEVPVAGLGSAAYTESSAYATAAQGSKADSAVQSVSIATGSTNGKVKLTVDGSATEASVYGLKSAAYTESSAYATSTQGSKADSAVQSIKVLGETLTDGGELTVPEAKTALGLKSAAYTDSNLYATAAQGTKADNAATAKALEDEIARAKAAEAKALTDAKAYTNQVKDSILGEGISETFDTLVEIQQWIEGDGVNATELSEAIAGEAARAKAAEEANAANIKAISDDYVKNNQIANMATTSYVDQAETDAIATAGTNADSKISTALQSYTTTSGMNGAIATAKSEAISAAASDATSKANQALEDAKDYADGLASNYATAAQGTKADTALQPADIVTGTSNGTISVDGTNVAVKGLGTAAYKPSSDFATAAQGRKADSAVQNIAAGTGITVSGDIVWTNVSYTSVGVGGIQVNRALPNEFSISGGWVANVTVNGTTYYDVNASGSGSSTIFNKPSNTTVDSTGTATIVFHNPNPTVAVNTDTIATVQAMGQKATETLNQAKSYADGLVATDANNYFVINCGSSTTVI